MLSMFCRQTVLTTLGYDGGRGQLLSTADDDCHLLITLGVQLCICVQHNWRLGVMVK